MNNDLISKIDAQFAFVEKCIGDCKRCDHNRAYPDGDKRCALIDEAPTVDAEPVRHGYWIQSKSVPAYHSCSYCHAAHKMHESCNTYVLLNYCPNCGTKMDGDANAAD